MLHPSETIYIIGAGISGLIAAKTLEEKGYAPVILEAAGTPGGRVQTDEAGGIAFDRGFQVLLTAYPQAKKHLDFGRLDLRSFLPGALVFEKGKRQQIGDPLRDISSLLPTMTSRVGTLADKWKILRLSSMLKRKSLPQIFSTPEKTTRQYLEEYGFSDRIIRTFFTPFFGGIFLEAALNTSSRMFEFTFKMFSEGYAAIPAEGIGAISRQLADGLQKTTIRYHQQVQRVRPGEIHLEGGEVVPCRAALVTVPFNPETGELGASAGVDWERCDALYFTVGERTFAEGSIALVADAGSLVNNLYYPFGQDVHGDPVLSVTVVKDHSLEQAALVRKVAEDLERFCGIRTRSFLKHYAIEKALPRVRGLGMELQSPKSPFSGKVFRAGDYLLNASLNAAMASGEAAAEALDTALRDPAPEG
jgi:hypothetical protein